MTLSTRTNPLLSPRKSSPFVTNPNGIDHNFNLHSVAEPKTCCIHIYSKSAVWNGITILCAVIRDSNFRKEATEKEMQDREKERENRWSAGGWGRDRRVKRASRSWRKVVDGGGYRYAKGVGGSKKKSSLLLFPISLVSLMHRRPVAPLVLFGPVDGKSNEFQVCRPVSFPPSSSLLFFFYRFFTFFYFYVKARSTKAVKYFFQLFSLG